MAQLHFQSGPLAGKRMHLKGEQLSLGRGSANTIRVDDPSVAQRHLLLVADGEGYTLYIDASKPPVAINGKQVVNETLRDGDELQIGTVRARYSCAPVLDAVEAPKLPRRTLASPSKRAQAPLSLDDAEPLPRTDSESIGQPHQWKRIFAGVAMIVIMLAGSSVLLRKEWWKDTPHEEERPPIVETKVLEIEPAVAPSKPKRIRGPIGACESGLLATGKVHRTRHFKSHQAAVDAAAPGDSVIFDSADVNSIVVRKPVKDVQFLSGSASWELRADLIDCQFFFHEAKQIEQRSGKLEGCAFFHCSLLQTHLTHTDAVSFYFDERTILNPNDRPNGSKRARLLLSGFVRNVLIMKPFTGSPKADKRFDMDWGPAIDIDATDAEGDGRGTYILSPVVRGARAWTAHRITRGRGITYAHLTTDHAIWADSVLEILQGNNCVVLGTSLAGEVATTAEQFEQPPQKVKYRDHAEFGRTDGPAYRGAVMSIQGQFNRIVAHGDERKPWSLGRKVTLPGLHYEDGITAIDPFIQQYATLHGGLSVNFGEMKGAFIMQPDADGAEFHSMPTLDDGNPLYTTDGPNLHMPTFVPLKDLRINAGELGNYQLLDMTGKKPAEIEKALSANKSIFLGAGTYEFTTALRSGFIAGAGMDNTILQWPDDIDCTQSPFRGAVNCTVRGGRIGYNGETAAASAKKSDFLFLRSRFVGQRAAAINLREALFETWQDCEFIDCPMGISHGLDSMGGKDHKVLGKPTAIDNLNICNCTFRDLNRAILLSPESPRLGHIGIHNCDFENIADSAIRIEGGQTHLIQLCQLSHCATQGDAWSIRVSSQGVVALSHLNLSACGGKGIQPVVSLQGHAVVSHCAINGPPSDTKRAAASLKSIDVLAADHVIAEGRLEAPKDSLLCRCRFRNMDLPDGTARARNDDFVDVTAQTLALVDDLTAPMNPVEIKVEPLRDRVRIEWNPPSEPTSGVAGYLIFNDGKEIARTPFRYESPSDIHAPLLRIPADPFYEDRLTPKYNYSVRTISGAGLTMGNLSPAPRRLLPPLPQFQNKDGKNITISDFIFGKGKLTHIIDGDGNKLPVGKLGHNGAPALLIFGFGETVEPQTH